MKTFSFWLVVAVVVAAGCHKSGSGSGGLVTGQWKWVQSDWIVGLDTGQAYPGPDTTITLTFESGNQYAVVLNGKVVSSGSYMLVFGADSLLTFSGQLTSSSPAEFGLSGRYIYSTSTLNDTLTLVSDGPFFTPAGASTTLKFVGLFNPGAPAVPGQ